MEPKRRGRLRDGEKAGMSLTNRAEGELINSYTISQHEP
jgi:hypothetical protein